MGDERDAQVPLRHGSLFSGIGGFDLGFERAGFTTAWQVELAPYCLKVLEKNFPDAKRYRDIRAVHGALAHAQSHAGQLQSGEREGVRDQSAEHGASGIAQCADCLPPVEVITGGFPCQPFSLAGKRRGQSDDRDLWPDMRRVIEELRPRWVVAENVPGLITLALDQVLADLEGLGYAVGAVTLPACAVDAPHRRERLWIVAHAKDERRHQAGEEQFATPGQARLPGNVANPTNAGTERVRQRQDSTAADVAHPPQFVLDGRRHTGTAGWRESTNSGKHDADTDGQSSGRIAIAREKRHQWLPEPDVGRVAHGVPARVDRLRCLGNALVPQLAEEIAWMIRRAEAEA